MFNHILAYIVLLLVLTVAPAGGAQFFTVSSDALDVTTTRFYPLSVSDMVSNAALGQTTLEAAEVPVPAGSFLNLSCVLSVAPGAGTSWTFTLLQNGTPTALAFIISNPNRSSAAIASVTVNQGDVFALRIAPSAAPAPVATNGRCDLLYR